MILSSIEFTGQPGAVAPRQAAVPMAHCNVPRAATDSRAIHETELGLNIHQHYGTRRQLASCIALQMRLILG